MSSKWNTPKFNTNLRLKKKLGVAKSDTKMHKNIQKNL